MAELVTPIIRVDIARDYQAAAVAIMLADAAVFLWRALLVMDCIFGEFGHEGMIITKLDNKKAAPLGAA